MSAETELAGSWDGELNGRFNLGIKPIDQSCKPKRLKENVQVKVTLRRLEESPRTLAVKIEPIGEGFFERGEANCNTGDMADPWPISPERLFRSRILGDRQDSQGFYDKTETAGFDLIGVAGTLSGNYKVKSPKEEISASPSPLGLPVGSYHVTINGTVELSATPVMNLDLPPVKNGKSPKSPRT